MDQVLTQEGWFPKPPRGKRSHKQMLWRAGVVVVGGSPEVGMYCRGATKRGCTKVRDTVAYPVCYAVPYQRQGCKDTQKV